MVTVYLANYKCQSKYYIALKFHDTKTYFTHLTWTIDLGHYRTGDIFFHIAMHNLI